jgi:hypothetical protein
MGSGGVAPQSLTSTLDGEWLTLPWGERARGTHSVGSWVDPRAGLDVMEKSKVSLSLLGM